LGQRIISFIFVKDNGHRGRLVVNIAVFVHGLLLQIMR
jgi:hypothetical protein